MRGPRPGDAPEGATWDDGRTDEPVRTVVGLLRSEAEGLRHETMTRPANPAVAASLDNAADMLAEPMPAKGPRDEVLVEGSYFERADLPRVLGNYMRGLDGAQRDIKATYQRAEAAEAERDEAFAEIAACDREAWKGRAIPAEAERDALRRWKAEALPVMAGLQDLGNALGLPLGASVTGEMALAVAVALRAKVAAVAEVEDSWSGRILPSSAWPHVHHWLNDLRAALAATGEDAPAPEPAYDPHATCRYQREAWADAVARGEAEPCDCGGSL